MRGLSPQVLQERPQLRELLALPRADRAPCGRPGGAAQVRTGQSHPGCSALADAVGVGERIVFGDMPVAQLYGGLDECAGCARFDGAMHLDRRAERSKHENPDVGADCVDAAREAKPSVAEETARRRASIRFMRVG